VILVLLLQVHGGTAFSDIFLTELDDDLGCSLAVHANFAIVVNLIGICSSLALRAKWNIEYKLGLVFIIAFSVKGLNWYARLDQVLYETFLGNVSCHYIKVRFFINFNAGSAVKDDGFMDVIGAGKGVKSFVDFIVHLLALEVSRHHSHHVFGEGACLVCADLIGVAHGLR